MCRFAWSGLLLSAIAIVGCTIESTKSANHNSPEARAVAFLTREVPAWRPENGCFSCHNNGDAARALFMAKRRGFVVPEAALADTLHWVTHPAGWDDNQGDPGFSDQRLADIQFAASLLDALQAGQSQNQGALREAASRVAAHQRHDGPWPITMDEILGAPATYGNALATHMALRVLKDAARPTHVSAIENGRRWLGGLRVRNVPDAAAVVFEFSAAPEAQLRSKALEAAAWLQNAQNPDHGWGPFPQTATEAFDTALAILALSRVQHEEGVRAAIQSGRQRLISLQLKDGSWPATTRPTGNESYAQQMSTTGWATMALFETSEQEFGRPNR